MLKQICTNPQPIRLTLGLSTSPHHHHHLPVLLHLGCIFQDLVLDSGETSITAISTLRRQFAHSEQGVCYLLKNSAPAQDIALSSQEGQRPQLHILPWNNNLYPVCLFAVLICSAQPCTTRLTLKPMPLHSQEWRGVGGAGGPTHARLTANTTPVSAVRLTLS
jgi:hypothetical protein